MALRSDPSLLGTSQQAREMRLLAVRQGFSLVAEEPPPARFGPATVLSALLMGMGVGMALSLALR
jgi:hypothetical protein